MTKTVLLVEDEQNIMEAIRFILSRAGWRVEVHSRGDTALAEIERVRPDVLILDVMLPNRSGYDILRDVRAHDDLSALPILMLTARGQTKDREMAEQFGVNCFMTKPFSNSEVLECINKLAEV